ncbi:amidohydrolase family protein [Novosphingobium sp. PhB165]|uniref:amidohydrolase family protein n=1 Tax=Novosphingobium sp. PhB165 TaxID=2485105 RepID=UPI001046C950|nr:amidohydrolase family protein [Novosphingobium sp. PhB165]TCM20592.1 amidohydrolase family protein [Novosphingobium sp. PhB165]
MTILEEANANREIEAAPRVVDYVVDADVHVTPPPTMWKEYLSPEFRDQAPTVETVGDVDYVVFEGQRRQVHLMQSQAGRKTEEYKNVGKFSDMRLGGWQAEKRIEDMDRDGMDKAVLFGGGPLQTGNLDLFFDSFDAFNRWQSDFCAYDRKRLFSAAFLPTVDVSTTVRMMHEARKRGDVAVNIPAFPQSIRNFTKMSSIWQAMTGDSGGDRQYRDAEFDPIWATAQELDLAITFHLGARVSRYKDKTNFLPDIPMGKTAMLEVVSIMLYGGVFDRFPKLRIGLIESGVGWIPWACEYMDRTWEMQRHWTECTIKHPPSHYFDQNVYASFISDRIGIELRHKSGCKNIMWSSDYPHSETTFPHSHAVIEENFRGVPKAERDWIVAGCAEKFFGIG